MKMYHPDGHSPAGRSPWAWSWPAEPLNLENDTTRINYSLGYQIGGDFKRQGVDMNAAAITQGIADALSGAEPLMKPEDMLTTLADLKQKIVAEQRQRSPSRSSRLPRRARSSWRRTPSRPESSPPRAAFSTRLSRQGTGKTPGPTDQVTVHYRGTLVDGQEFDSSHKLGQPTSFKLNGVVKGWTEGLQLIKEGGKIKLFVPAALAYGGRGPLANQTLIFEVELITVGEPEKPAAAEPAKPKG